MCSWLNSDRHFRCSNVPIRFRPCRPYLHRRNQHFGDGCFSSCYYFPLRSDHFHHRAICDASFSRTQQTISSSSHFSLLLPVGHFRRHSCCLYHYRRRSPGRHYCYVRVLAKLSLLLNVPMRDPRLHRYLSIPIVMNDVSNGHSSTFSPLEISISFDDVYHPTNHYDDRNVSCHDHDSNLPNRFHGSGFCKKLV
jgi:hypothetical protein